MQIQVIFWDNAHDRIESHTLSSLIREGKIKAFKRSNGWAYIGKDRIRKYDYIGLERRCAFANHENDLHYLQETNL
jgi:predicted site-specific integrase-resolvase